MSDERHICIHGHFYQPPRENPFTGEVQDQSSAAPYANWNQRINAEAYAANLTGRILDNDGSITAVVNNYESISFDFGPTLLSWLKENAADTYRGVIEADRVSIQRFGGHGSAIAQSYNHSILPLANRRDRVTQIRWGLTDFEHRFGRRSEGMWLPETAVDGLTLQLLADEGVGFTILSPHQAESVCSEDGDWTDVSDGSIDTRFPYRVELSDQSSITVFFYNGALSHDIAFGGLLDDGESLAGRLIMGLGDPMQHPVLSHVATDGETYGHHHPHGEMALASAIAAIDEHAGVSLANYGQFLSDNAPLQTVRILDATSWSCAHGVERWRSDCGCATGGHPDWDQKWRGPLRNALDWLRDAASSAFAVEGAEVLADPWVARDAYIEVLLGRPVDEFLSEHGEPDLDQQERRLALALLEIQYRSMLMYTSCGWFFDDIAGLEAVFVLRQAGRLIELTREALSRDLQPGFLSLLALARSNQPGTTGRSVYESEVTPFMGLRK